MKKQTHTRYCLRNWAEYNAALKRRGSLDVWLGGDVAEHWLSTEASGKRGASYYFSDLAIETVSLLGSLYHLAGRQATGFVESIFELMGLDLRVPNHSTVSRRLRRLEVSLEVREGDKARHVVVDSTGIKVFGEGEWKTRQHGVGKRRTWNKLHLALDESTHELLSAVVSSNDFKDNQLLDDLLDQIEGPIDQVSADGAYDSWDCYASIERRDARAAIPPRKDARIKSHGNRPGKRLVRDENLREIRQKGRAQWKRDCGYHRRSLAETAMYRMKAIFGGRVKGRRFDVQAAELLLQCLALNRMTRLGMPDTVAVQK